MQKNPVRPDTDTKDKAAPAGNMETAGIAGIAGDPEPAGNVGSAGTAEAAGDTEPAGNVGQAENTGSAETTGTAVNMETTVTTGTAVNMGAAEKTGSAEIAKTADNSSVKEKPQTGSGNSPEAATKEKSGIAYQNKDIFAKIFGEGLKEKSFAAYGLDVPKIAEVLPTNLPAVEANELRLDNLFRFEDGSLGLTDYESAYDGKDKVKYLGYIVRVLKHNSLIGRMERKIRMIVIYTGDIIAGQTKPELHIGCLDFRVEEVFLSNLDAPALEASLTGSLEQNRELTEEEQMKFIILPLAYKGQEAKRACIRRLFGLIEKLPEGKLQIFLLSGLLVFTDKVIRHEDSEYMKGWINMTQIGRLYAEEMRAALLQKDEENEAAMQKLKTENAEKVQKLKTENAEKVQKLKTENAEKVQKLKTENAEKVQKLAENVQKLKMENAEKVQKLKAENSENVQKLKKSNRSIEQAIVNLFGRGFTPMGIHEVLPDIPLERIEALRV